MKILNIHGYKGNSCNSAFSALKNSGFETVSPQIDYDKLEPEIILQNFCREIDDNKINLIVGTSLGGFYAAILSVRKNIPVILVNPCLMPFVYLPRLGYSGDIKPYINLFSELSEIKSQNVNAVIGGQDETIDAHDFTINLIGDKRCQIVPDGKHSGATLNLESHFKKILITF